MKIKNILNLKPYLLIVICLSSISFVQAETNTNEQIVKNIYNKNYDLENYIGFEFSGITNVVTSNNTDMYSESYGKNAYPKNHLFYGVFIGHKFNDFVSLELSYETQARKSRTVTLVAGDHFPGGDILQADNSATLETKSQVKNIQPMLHLTYMLKNKKHISLWGELGFSISQLRAEQTMLSATLGNPPVPLTQDDLDARKRTFKQWKVVPAAGVGVDYDFNRRLGIRVMAGWRDLSMLKAKSKENPNGTSEVRLKDGVNLGIGFYFRF